MKPLRLESIDMYLCPVTLRVFQDKDNKIKLSEIDDEELLSMSSTDVNQIRHVLNDHRKMIYSVQGVIDLIEDHKTQNNGNDFTMRKVKQSTRKKKALITRDEYNDFQKEYKSAKRVGDRYLKFNGKKIPMAQASAINNYIEKQR